ncbi:MAG TPA: hypothetical protein VMC10_26070 [Stellaceae bacterium]|nr:hypothetical protein [Stellaceae bacterium]
MTADILVLGTGSFAARIVFDLAATATKPVTVAVAGRNAERLSWLRIAGNARAGIFGARARFESRAIDLLNQDALGALIDETRPAVLVQAASSQPSSVIATQGDAWSKLVAEGGLSATAVFQAQLTMRVAQTIRNARLPCQLINCCFPDVVNSLIAAAGLSITCGVGNIAILSNAFAGELGLATDALKMLAHYQCVTPFRRAAQGRSGPVARVWIDGTEVADVFQTFAGVKITPEPAIEISGASGVPMMLAMASGTDWSGHVPGALGLPGGYPVAWRDGKLDLDLPAAITRAEAIAWNAQFEERNGMVVDGDGTVRYTGVLHDRLRDASPDLARGFPVRDLEAVYGEMAKLRARLQAQRAG